MGKKRRPKDVSGLLALGLIREAHGGVVEGGKQLLAIKLMVPVGSLDDQPQWDYF